MGAYAIAGYGWDFLQANFFSVMSDTNLFLPAVERLLGLVFGLFPLGICIGFAWRYWRRQEDAEARQVRWLFAWGLASFFGFVAFGVWYDHYVLPLLVPFCLLAALGMDHTRWRAVAMALVVGLGWVGGTGRAYVVEWSFSGNATQARQLLAMVEPRLGNRCLYVNEDVPYLYRLTNACLPTRYTFPQHLTMWRYERGLGVDQMAEFRRVLASRPGVIVINEVPDEDTKFATRDEMFAALKQAYTKVGTTRLGERDMTVYALAERFASAPSPRRGLSR